MSFVAITFLWDAFLLVYFSCGILVLRGVVLATCLFCRMSFQWAHIPVGFSYLEFDMKVVVMKPKHKRRSMHVFQCLVEMIERLLSPRTTFRH